MDRREALKYLLANDLYAFTQKCFATLRPGEQFLPNWHIQAMCYALQQLYEGKVRRLVINVMPRALKSMLVSVAFPAWILGRNPSLQIIGISYSSDLSAGFSRDTRTIMESAWYKEVFPNTRLDSGKNTETEFTTTARGTRYATSTGGTLTGRGCDFMILDDPQKPDEVMSETTRDNAKRWWEGTARSRFNDPTRGAGVMVTQRLHVDDLTAHLFKQGWRQLALPAMAETDMSVPIGPGRTYHWRAGEALHPQRLPCAEIEQIKLTAPATFYSAQLMQKPVPDEGAAIKREWLKSYDVRPVSQQGDLIVQSWDTANKAGPQNDFSVCLTFLCRNDQYFLIDIFRQRVEAPQLRAAAIQRARDYNPNIILIEDAGSGSGLISELRQPGIGLNPRAVKPHTNKRMRLLEVEMALSAGRVVLPTCAAWTQELLAELLAFPNVAHDDQVDALTQFLAYIEEQRRVLQLQDVQIGLGHTPVTGREYSERMSTHVGRDWRDIGAVSAVGLGPGDGLDPGVKIG